MVLAEMLDRVKKLVRPNRQPTAAQSQASATEAREKRSGSVTRLQNDVRRLQHEISELSDAEEGDTGGSGQAPDTSRMASLQRQLAEKQKELARYQARV